MQEIVFNISVTLKLQTPTAYYRHFFSFSNELECLQMLTSLVEAIILFETEEIRVNKRL